MLKKISQRGAVSWWIIVIVVVVVIIGAVVAEQGADNNNDDSTGGNNGQCPSYCLAFVELECGSNKLVGGCFGLWDCEDGVVNECRN